MSSITDTRSTDERPWTETLNPEVVQTVPVLEETLAVSKRRVSEGSVRVKVATETVEEIARATLERGTVEVTRVPVGKVVERTPEVRTEGDVTIFPVMEEVVVVETRLMLKEELHVRQVVTTETVEEPVLLRRQRAVVERLDSQGRPSSEPEILS